MFEDRTLDSLYRERNRLMVEVDEIERGETECIRQVYARLLNRICNIDRHIERRKREAAVYLDHHNAWGDDD